MRRDIVNAVNRACEKADDNTNKLNIDVMQMYDILFKFKKENPVLQMHKQDISIRFGVLYINGKAMERVAPIIPKVPYDEKAYYIEGSILAQSGL